jgi:hypothetical protein
MMIRFARHTIQIIVPWLSASKRDWPVTDGLFFHLYRPDKIGTDTIHHNAAHPSQVVLPVLAVD